MALRDRNLDLIAEIVGREVAFELAMKAPVYGRQRWFYIPARVNGNDKLSRTIGLSFAEKLCRAMGGCNLTLGKPEIFDPVQFAQRAAPLKPTQLVLPGIFSEC